jgi:hypothetical protein
MVRLGRYRHYKGNEYQVLFLAKDSDTEEDVVVYQDCNDSTKVWVRSLRVFTETVDLYDATVPRFTFLHE